MYTAKKFNIPELKGISAKNIEEHYKLYEGYVKHTNLILEKIAEITKNSENGDEQNRAVEESRAYEISEAQRRFGFEFDGMKNHEIYFASLEDGTAQNSGDTAKNSQSSAPNLKSAIEKEWGSFDAWLARFKTVAKTRGIGWAILYYDKSADKLLNAWIDEQHLGHLTGATPILALDMWEHSFVADYQPSGKGQYIDDFFENLNWAVIENNYNQAVN